MEADSVGLSDDWELLQNPDDTGSAVDPGNFSGIDSDSDGAIRSNHFSLDGQRKFATDYASEEGSVESDTPSWIDPATSLTRYGRKNSCESWSDSSSDRSEERRFSEIDATNELNSLETVKNCLGFGETEAERESEEIRFRESKFSDLDVIKESNYFGETQAGDKVADNCISNLGYGDIVRIPETSEFSSESTGEEGHSVERKSDELAELKCDSRSVDGVEKRRISWWKVPFEVLKYCVYRVSPVWSFSVAAAFVGFIILGRRLYKMRRKSPGLKLKITVDDKVSICVTINNHSFGDGD